MYTNLDTFHNKSSELLTRIHELKPDIIGLTEVKPKMTTWIMQESDLVITGYTLYSDLRGRGVALYVKDDLRSTEVESFTTDTPEASVWCSVPLINRDNLLVGVVYRSPNACITNNTLLNSTIPM